jgi:HK97 family phage portal protein
MKVPSFLQRKPKQKEERYATYGGENEEPDMKVVMPQWMYNPAHGTVRIMRNGEVFNSVECRLLGMSVVVWQCKKRIADAVVNCPWKILPADPEHPNKEKIAEVENFFRNPNTNNETFNNIIFSTIMDLLDLDAGAIVKVYGKYAKNKLLQIYSRDGSTFIKEADKYGRISRYWQFSYAGEINAIPLETRELIYLSENPRSDSMYGESPLETLRLIIRNLVKGIETQELVYRKGGIPSGIMGLEGLNATEFNSFKEWWDKEQKNKKYQRAMINVPVKWVPLVSSFKDLEFLDSQKWFAELVYRTFKVPHVGMGTAMREAKGSMNEEDLKFMRETIRPKLVLVEQAINQQLIPDFYPKETAPDCYFHYDVIDTLQEQGELELWEKKWGWGAATVNQYRLSKSLPPLKWGDANPMMLKEIQQVCQSWFYGAFDTATLSKILGIEIVEQSRKLLAKAPTQKETQPP